jgi:broad specificity phosphatase PhoE
MTALFLLRHGPTQAGTLGAPLGRLDLPVTDAGQALWPRVRAELLTLGLQQVLTSELARARVHAEALGLPVRVLPSLGEQDFGVWDGVPWAQNTGTGPFFLDPVHACPPGGEAFAQCASRSLKGVSEALAPGLPTLILAHGGPLRAILAHFLGLPLERALDLAWQPFGLTRLELYAADRGVLAFHNRSLPT